MNSFMHQENTNCVRVASAGAIGAVTMLGVGAMNIAFFDVGTVLLVLCIIALARGMGTRGGAITGLLLGLVWVVARLGLTQTFNINAIINELNVMVVMAMSAIGGLSGAVFASKQCAVDADSPQDTSVAQGKTVQALACPSRIAASPSLIQLDDVWSEVLARHREWLATWDQASAPWTSFDNHVRELVRMLTGLRHLRCYRVGSDGRLSSLNQDAHKDTPQLVSSDLLTHVVTTGKPYHACAADSGPMIQQLAEASEAPLVWAVPVRDRGVTVGLIAAGDMGDPPATADRIQQAADLTQILWLHVHHLELLRLARQTDRGSGLINRADFLPSLKITLEHSYKVHEPVVVMMVCLEGLRSLDDANLWARRDALIEKVGLAIANSIRKDDIVGRFSDAQFVALLRRLDTPLAELICRKLMGNIAKVICDYELTAWITPRAGLCGSGFTKTTAEELLTHASNALTKARTQDMLLLSESPGVQADKFQEASA